MDADYLVVLVTVADAKAGEALGRALVGERLAACVQVIPRGTAIYRWQGKLRADPQVQLLIKTRRDVWPVLRGRILALHEDQVPEIVALPVADGLPEYLRWLDEGTTGGDMIAALVASEPAAGDGWPGYAEVYPTGKHTVVGTVRVQRGVESPQLGNRRDLTVYLPPSYGRSDRRYPVLYMHDGQNLFDEATSYAGEWRVDETMEALGAQGIEAIVVGIAHAGERRPHEYIPFPDDRIEDTQGDRYVRFIVETVKPLIDRDLRTLPGRETTGIAGSSLGGLISLYAFFRFPEVFGLAGVFSPSLRRGDKAIFPFVAASPWVPGRIYLDVGAQEGVGRVEKRKEQQEFARRYLRLVRKMNDLLVSLGYKPGRNLLFVEDEGGVHHESAWARRLPAALRFLLGGSDRSPQQ